jgi:hypothetical protein
MLIVFLQDKNVITCLLCLLFYFLLSKLGRYHQVLVGTIRYLYYSLVCIVRSGNTKEGSITVPLTSCLTGLESVCFANNKKIVSCHTEDSKPVKQEVNSTVILPPLVFPGSLVLHWVMHG